jgi:HTH-type transcriptional regulator / antitoxin HigA
MVSKTIQNEYQPDHVSPPGDTLAEVLESLNMTQSELAERAGRPLKTINEIIKGKTALTPETALQLEKVLNIRASFWNNREKHYRTFLAAQAEKERLEANLDWLKKIPVKQMMDLGWIPKVKDKIGRLHLLLGFFSVAGPEQWKQVWTKPLVAYRESRVYKTKLGALSSWLRKGEVEAQKIDCAEFNKTFFKKALVNVRQLVKEKDPGVFIPELERICAECGVAVVFIPQLKGMRQSGATYWPSAKKAVIQLSGRYKTNDHLWFTFFHEAGHILLHKKLFIIEGLNAQDETEKEADRFACDYLIPKSLYRNFTKIHSPKKSDILEFAKEVDIDPAIIVGRLQHEKRISFATKLNELKTSYQWEE